MPPVEVEDEQTEKTVVIPVETERDLCLAYFRALAESEVA